MDTLTHIVVGACIGEVFLGKQLGRRALVWGAVAQSAPDVDAIAVLWTSTAENLLVHRGFSHSFLFCALLTPLLAYVADRLHRPHESTFTRFCWFFGVAIFGHVLLDGLNAYGTGWLEPFSDRRFSLNVLFVADPFFTFGPGVAALVLFSMRRYPRYHFKLAMAGLLWCMLYTGYAAYNRITIDRRVQAMLAAQQVPHSKCFITPTVMNTWLWYVVAGDDRGYHIGYCSVFDTAPTMQLHYSPRNDQLLTHAEDRTELELLVRLSQGFYTLEERGDSLLFNDLRFGRIMGWRDPHAPFVFHYHLRHKGANDMVVQRGRLAGWDRGAVGSLIRRIRGN